MNTRHEETRRDEGAGVPSERHRGASKTEVRILVALTMYRKVVELFEEFLDGAMTQSVHERTSTWAVPQ